MKRLTYILLLFCLGCTPEWFTDNCTKSIVLWDNGVVPYAFNDNTPEGFKDTVYAAMALYERNTNVRFMEYEFSDLSNKLFETHEVSQALLVKYTGYDQSISGAPGYLGGFDETRIGNKYNRRILIHELGHKLGLPHEFQRRFRDLYVKVYYDSIPDNWVANFDTYDICFQTPYAYESVMNYDLSEFAHVPMEAINGSEIKASDTLTELDVMKINELYP